MHDSDSDSADDEADFRRFVAAAETADSDSREAWAASRCQFYKTFFFIADTKA
jgi:hypothetical protein